MKKMKLSCLIIIIIQMIIFTPNLHGQDHDIHEHHIHLYEIGISTGIVFMQPEGETAYGLHLHGMRRLGEEGFFKHIGLGVGLEMVFSEHHHYNLMGTLAVYPTGPLVITLSPGLLMVTEDGENIKRFSFHMEVMAEFEVGSFEMGPSLGFSVAGEDTHFTLGIHIGKGF